MDRQEPDTRVLTAAIEEACKAVRAAEFARERAQVLQRKERLQHAEDRVRLCRVMLRSACYAFIQRIEGSRPLLPWGADADE